ncbi:MAG: hypothetical protein Kow0091_14520 [Geminocystis sp.]
MALLGLFNIFTTPKIEKEKKESPDKITKTLRKICLGVVFLFVLTISYRNILSKYH